MKANRQIGWYILDEEKVFTDNGYECAAWWRRVKVPAGKYPMIGYFNYEDRRKVDDVYIQYEGELVEDYFGSRFCGVPIGTYDTKQNTGEKADYHERLYGYMVAEMILDGDTRFELSPDMECIAEEHVLYTGENYLSKQIVRRDCHD